MKRACLFILVALAALLAAPTALRAQVPAPGATPTPDPQVYNDPAMHFRAPNGFYALGQHPVSLENLGDDPQVVAGWVYPDRDHPRKLAIQIEYYVGDVGGFDGVLEQQMRDQFETAIFKNKQNTTLKNGMPAMFMEMTSGEGFNVQKGYFLIWTDGQRGVALILITQLNDVSTETARAILSDATAVRYPTGRDQ
ncbi:MAG TPA: hypothetical protein VMV65_08435 [Alphaproteobacteria bacterium]|nr:hypothetical protein [Alphaproteobacteria bacterium]